MAAILIALAASGAGKRAAYGSRIVARQDVGHVRVPVHAVVSLYRYRADAASRHRPPPVRASDPGRNVMTESDSPHRAGRCRGRAPR